MDWYKNLKIKVKFTISFALILISFLIAGFVGITTITSVISSFGSNVSSRATVVDTCTNVVEKLVSARAVILNVDKSLSVDQIKREIEPSVEEAVTTLNSFLDSLKEALPMVSEVSVASILEQQEVCETTLERFNTYVSSFYSYVEALHSGNTVLANSINAELVTLSDTMFTEIFQLPDMAYQGLVSETEIIKSASNVKVVLVVVIFIISIIISLVLAVYLSTSIRKPISKLSKDSKTIADGNLDVSIRNDAKDELGELSNAIGDMSDVIKNILNDINNLSLELSKGNCSYFIDSNKYKGAFKDVVNAINTSIKVLIEDTVYTIDRIEEFSNGNFSTEIKTFPGEKASIKIGLDSVKNALLAVSGDITSLVNAANEGNLEFKLNTDKYAGQWKETCIGLNNFVDNVVVPIKETQNALNQFAKGNFSHRITNEYKGEFNEIKKTVNFTAETIGLYISEISETLTKMSNKDFNVSIDNEYLGDFKEIQNSVNNIVSNLNILVKDIISSAEQVNAGAKQISESSISLAEGATEQAEAVENLTSAVKLISDQAVTNAQNSEKANGLALETKENAASGSEQMNSMLTAMEEINNASSSISNIIKVIDDIAFQTNILALNAAVEAARAGEHGKGFAVVAEEVRNLAARSQEAAKETTELIQSSVDKVAEGSKIANNTAESLLVIVNQIEEISNLVNSCALSSKEQEKSIEEMTKGLIQIESVTQDNTATSEESAAASEELASQAEVFYTSVSDFKLKEDGTSSVKQNTKKLNTLDSDISPINVDESIDFGKY